MLKSRTWFTEDTELLTPTGWVSIKELDYIKSVITVGESIKPEGMLEFNRGYYRGPVKEWRMTDFYCKAKHLILPDNKIWRVGKNIELEKPFEVQYKGFIYNIITPSNTLITRCLKRGKNNEDYILSLCQIVD